MTLQELVVEEMCQDTNYISVWLAYRCQHDPTLPHQLARMATETDSAALDTLISELRWNIREHAMLDKGQIEYRMSLPRGEDSNDGD